MAVAWQSLKTRTKSVPLLIYTLKVSHGNEIGPLQ